MHMLIIAFGLSREGFEWQLKNTSNNIRRITISYFTGWVPAHIMFA